MWVIGDRNQISEDVFYFMIFYLPFPQKSIRSELAKLFTISICMVTWKLSGSGTHHPYPKQALVFACLQYKSLKNTVGQGEIARNRSNFSFSHSVFYMLG